MGTLSFDNMMTAEDVMDLFGPDEPVSEEPETKEHEKALEEEPSTINITEDANSIFHEEEEAPESVGDKNREKSSEVPADTKPGSSQNNFSSIAKTLKEYGTFEHLSDEDIEKITDGEKLIEALDKAATARFDERYKRVEEALNSGIEPSVVQQYETIIDNLDKITEETIKNESDESVALRQNLIYQDYINRGYSKERAEKEVKKSMNAATDIEDALDALEGNKEFYKSAYNKLIKENKDKADADKKKLEQQATALREAILNDEKAFNDLNVDKATRKKIYDNISKPIYRNANTNKQLTAVQKYAEENPTEFQKYLGLVFTLTDGFEDFSGLIKGPVKKEMKAKIKEMERVINTSNRGGEPNLFGATPDDESSFGVWRIDV